MSQSNHTVFLTRAAQVPPSSKKGIANTGVIDYGTMTPLSAASQGIAVNQLGLSWYYNYGPTPGSRAKYGIPITDPGPTVLTPGVSFVPMILDAAHDNPAELAMLDPYARAAGAVLMPNEPYQAGEANMTPAACATLCHKLNVLYPPGSGVRIGSPAGFGNEPALSWFNTFFALIAANGDRVDFFAHHWGNGYVGQVPAASYASWQAQLNASKAAYGLPIWITEQEIYDTVSNTSPPAQFVTQCWQLIVPVANADVAVERWAWWPEGPSPFTGQIATWSYANFDGTLTPLGQAYSLL